MRELISPIATFVIITAVISASVHAVDQNDPAQAVQNAMANVKAANVLTEQAALLLKGRMGRQQIESAIHLYIKAGQLYEGAAKVFQAVGPNYVSAENTQNVMNAMNECVKAVQTLKQRLQGF